VIPFERRVELRSRAGAVVAEVEDCQHHFALTIEHDGSVATGFAVDPIRAPWSTCVDALAELDELVGATVGQRPATSHADQHCTHLLDLALAGVRFAGLGLERRTYSLTVVDYTEPVSRAWLVRDDGFRLDWTLRDRVVVGPAEHAGHGLGSGFTAWAVGLAPDAAEAVLLLRRAAWMAPAQLIDLDDYETLSQTGLAPGVCWSAQPQRIHLTRRIRRVPA